MSIPLTKGRFALVDEADYEWLCTSAWRVTIRPTNAYAFRWIAIPGQKGKREYMHRVILNAPPGSETDHVNRNGLDNRRENLRLATRAQNNQNRQGSKPGATGVHGVYWHSRKHLFCARVWREHKVIWFHYFHRLEDAAAAVKEARATFYTHAPECSEQVIRRELGLGPEWVIEDAPPAPKALRKEDAMHRRVKPAS